jgi:hypothetical protein
VLDGLCERQKHGLGELRAGFDRTNARALTQLSGDTVDEFLSVPELAIGSDSHSALVHTTLSKPFCSGD